MCINILRKNKQKKCVKKHKGEKITLAGDVRYDSAGFNSFYCLYLVLCCMTNKILGFKLESKQPGKVSASMDSVAAKKVLEELIQEDMRIGIFVSDRCPKIGKVVKEIGEQNNINIMLEYNAWHIIKSLLKDNKHVTELQPWLGEINNFIWFSFNTRLRETMKA